VSLLRDFGRFWWDFVVGDEWRMAVIVAVAAVLGGVAARNHRIDGTVLACLIAAGVMIAVVAVIITTARRRTRLPRG
jgi:hypothetical protein